VNEKQFLRHHEDNSMDDMNITWVQVQYGRITYYRRETDEEKALRVLAEADMLPVVTLDEVPL
jgi:hypothetical protein